MYKGYFANVWRVLNFDTDVKDVENWGARAKGADGLYKPQKTICYRDGVLGVAVRIDTGERVKKNTLQAFKSMYGSNKPAMVL